MRPKDGRLFDAMRFDTCQYQSETRSPSHATSMPCGAKNRSRSSCSHPPLCVKWVALTRQPGAIEPRPRHDSIELAGEPARIVALHADDLCFSLCMARTMQGIWPSRGGALPVVAHIDREPVVGMRMGNHQVLQPGVIERILLLVQI